MTSGAKSLYHVRFRLYGTTLGAWTRRDPLGYVDGLSMYEYCYSAGQRFNDPSGLNVWTQSTDGATGRHQQLCADVRNSACQIVGKFCVGFSPDPKIYPVDPTALQTLWGMYWRAMSYSSPWGIVRLAIRHFTNHPISPTEIPATAGGRTGHIIPPPNFPDAEGEISDETDNSDRRPQSKVPTGLLGGGPTRTAKTGCAEDRAAVAYLRSIVGLRQNYNAAVSSCIDVARDNFFRIVKGLNKWRDDNGYPPIVPTTEWPSGS